MKQLSITKDGDKTKLFLNGNELTDILEYQIISSTNGVAELTLKLMVDFPVEPN